MPRLGVVIASTREGRVGATVGDWFMERARQHGGFEAELVDLKAVNLPVLSEPNHPRLKKHTQETTKAWSATVDALDHLYPEWSYKPAGFVSYGGVSGGLRSTQMTKLMLTSFKIVPMVEQVAIPFVAKLIEDGRFTANEMHDKSAVMMLDELLRWTNAMAPLRAPANR